MKIEKIRKHKEYKELTKKIREFEPAKHKDTPTWFLDVAQKNFQLMMEYVDCLDEKADALIKYLGLGTGFVGFFLGSFLCKFNTYEKGLFFLGILSWIISVMLTLFIRMPSNISYPPPITTAFKDMDEYNDQKAAQAKFSLYYERAGIGQMIVGNNKANILKRANKLLFFALVLFLFSFLFVYF